MSCEYCKRERKPIDWNFCPMCGEPLSKEAKRPAERELTPEELKQMDGQPVWVVHKTLKFSGWMLVDSKNGISDGCYNFKYSFFIDDYGITWKAYNQRPEEG